MTTIGKKKGFTLIEILIASAVLSIFTFTGYKVFIAMSRSFRKGSWSLATQNKLRNGLNLLREEMQKATCRTDVSIDGTALTELGFEFHLTASDEITNDASIATWFICMPFVSGDADSPGAIIQCELKLAGKELLYSKALIEGSDPLNNERTLLNYPIVKNVAKITVSADDFDPDAVATGSLVAFEITVEHPDRVNQAEAHVVDRTGAKVNLEVIRDL